MKTLIIDDVKPVRMELKKILDDYPNIDVVGDAGNAAQAIPLIRSQQPDLVFLDIKLPGLSGFDILDQINEDFKVIFISTYEKYKEKARKYHPVDFMLKPIDKEKLNKAIQKLEC